MNNNLFAASGRRDHPPVRRPDDSPAVPRCPGTAMFTGRFVTYYVTNWVGLRVAVFSSAYVIISPVLAVRGGVCPNKEA